MAPGTSAPPRAKPRADPPAIMSSLFEQHPLRQTLNDEVHARPPVPLDTPEFVTYLAFLHHEGSASREAAHLAQLAE